MFQKVKTSAVPNDNQAKEKLANYVYEYLIHMNAPKSAQLFLQEISVEKQWPINESPGFLNQWWCIFYDLYSAAPERRETFEHSSEAKAFHDYGFVNSGFPNGVSRNPTIPSPLNVGMPPSVGRPSSQCLIPPDNGMHTPVSLQPGQMMGQGGPFYTPNHHIGQQGLEMMRNRGMMQPVRFHHGGQIPANYNMNRHRFNQPQPQLGIPHSPGPSGTPLGGPPIMASPVDSLQNDQQHQQQNTPGQDSFGPNGLSRSPAHGMSQQQQPAPVFPPPPASENNSDQSHPGSVMNGGNGTPIPQFNQQQQQQQQSHTMDYMSSFDGPGSQMKHSPQLHSQPSMNNDALSNGGDYNNPMLFLSEQQQQQQQQHGMRPGSQQMAGIPLSQMQHMMQHGLAPGHGQGPLTMQSMGAGPFMTHPDGPPFPVFLQYGDTGQ